MLLLVRVLCVVGVGEGDGVALPIVGISPAKAETDRTQIRISAIPSRFMVSPVLRITSPLVSGEIPDFWYRQINNKERFLAR